MAFILQSVGRKVTKTEGLEEGHVDASDDDRVLDRISMKRVRQSLR